MKKYIYNTTKYGDIIKIQVYVKQFKYRCSTGSRCDVVRCSTGSEVNTKIAPHHFQFNFFSPKLH